MEPTPQSGTPGGSAQAQGPVATRIIVKYVQAEAERLQNETAAENSAAELEAIANVPVRHIRRMSGNAHLVEVTTPSGPQSADAADTIERIAEQIAADPAVEYAEPDAAMQIQSPPNDPRYGQQWHYTRPPTSVNVEGGWAFADGAGTMVAVIDTGFLPHPDLADNLQKNGRDFVSDPVIANDGDGRDDNADDPGDWVLASETWCPNRPRNSSWHGTHVAGTVAAVTDNALGVAGVARKAKILPVRVLGKCGGFLSDIADGMRWAAGLPVPGEPANANPAHVLNLSLGGGGACGPVYQNAINDIVAAGKTIVVAAGNNFGNIADTRPANCENVISVVATNQAGARSYYSNSGPEATIAAPGGETVPTAEGGVLSTWNDGLTTPGNHDYAFYQGTSMAAPHVAGIAALLYQLKPNITPAIVASILQNTAKPFPTVSSNQCSTANCGTGIADATMAVKYLVPDNKSAAMPWMKILLNQ